MTEKNVRFCAQVLYYICIYFMQLVLSKYDTYCCTVLKVPDNLDIGLNTIVRYTLSHSVAIGNENQSVTFARMRFVASYLQ